MSPSIDLASGHDVRMFVLAAAGASETEVCSSALMACGAIEVCLESVLGMAAEKSLHLLLSVVCCCWCVPTGRLASCATD